MDATRTRRTKDPQRRTWYAHWRAFRFARHMSGPLAPAEPHPGASARLQRCWKPA